MTGTVLIPVSAGEMFDKITILRIKKERISDLLKSANVSTELEELEGRSSEIFPSVPTDVIEIISELQEVNRHLWQIEDDIREMERHKQFDEQFIQLARSVYFENDRRAKLKKAINIKVGSTLIEEKSYTDYQ